MGMTTPTPILIMKSTPKISQPELLLISDEAPSPTRWTLDERTREIGRKGLAEARAALRSPAHADLAA